MSITLYYGNNYSFFLEKKSLFQHRYLQLNPNISTELVIWVVLLWKTFKRRSRWKFKGILLYSRRSWARFFILKQPCIFEKVFDPLLLFLHYNSLFFSWLGHRYNYILWKIVLFNFDPRAILVLLPVFKCRGWVRLIPIELILKKYNFFLTSSLIVWCLDRMISGFLALTLVKFANSVNFSDDFSININPFLWIKLLLFEHRKMQHFILNFWVHEIVPWQALDVEVSQFGFYLNCSSHASTIL